MVSVAAGSFKELPFFPGGPLQSESALHDDGEKYETSDMPFIRFDRVSFRDCVASISVGEMHRIADMSAGLSTI